jgi:hypothetical protein
MKNYKIYEKIDNRFDDYLNDVEYRINIEFGKWFNYYINYNTSITAVYYDFDLKSYYRINKILPMNENDPEETIDKFYKLLILL